MPQNALKNHHNDNSRDTSEVDRTVRTLNVSDHHLRIAVQPQPPEITILASTVSFSQTCCHRLSHRPPARA